LDNFHNSFFLNPYINILFYFLPSNIFLIR
jgi:hypothetical protein